MIELAEPYDNVVEQLNDINADMPEAGTLQPLNREQSRLTGASGSFRWAA